MDTKERIKRPTPTRTRPLRNWSTLFSAAGESAAHAGAGSAGAKPEASLNDVVSRSVELGYRVVDEYIRQGQKVAQRFTERSYGPDAMAGDAQELAARMAQFASDFTALWFEMMQVGMSNVGRWPLPPFDGSGVAAGRSPAPPPAAPPSAAPAAEPPPPVRVKVVVTSPYPTEVSLDLRNGGAAQRLVAQSLRAVDEATPRLSDVAIEDGGEDAPMTLRIRVPDGQPPGVYNGLIIDAETGKPMGTVSLRIVPA